MSNIQSATPADFLNVAALDRIAWPQTPETFIPDGEHVWRVWTEYATVLVMRTAHGEQVAESGDIVGAVVMFPTQHAELFLHKVMVHPERRGIGIGTRLMHAALAQATAPVLLTVDPANGPAVRLYEKFGFRMREHTRGFYRPHEDRYLMVFEPA